MAPRPVTPPLLTIPESKSTVTVSIIDSTTRICAFHGNGMFEPEINGFDLLNCPAFSFLIEHSPSGRKLLWDLGVRKDLQNAPPTIAKIIANFGEVTVEKGVAEILQEGGVSPEEIDSIIWR